MPRSQKPRSRPTLPRAPKPTPPKGTPAHQEWLVDEADEESFPASDPSAEAIPGSTAQVNESKRRKK
jgi:hypothetical protein